MPIADFKNLMLPVFQCLQNDSQLVQQLGYSDQHNFRRAFKRYTGMLPMSV